MATFIAGTSNTLTGAGTTLSLSVPSGTLDGHQLLAFAHYTQSPGTPVITGWTMLGQASTSGTFSYLFIREALSEPASYNLTFSSNGSQALAAGIVTYSLGGPAGFYTGSSVSTTAGASGTTLTSDRGNFALFAGPDILRLILMANPSNASVTPPANVVERAQVVAGAASRVYIFEDQRTGDNGRIRATDTLTFTFGAVTARSTVSGFFFDGNRDSVMHDRFLVTSPPRILVI